jgi:hypothetical protein
MRTLPSGDAAAPAHMPLLQKQRPGARRRTACGGVQADLAAATAWALWRRVHEKRAGPFTGKTRKPWAFLNTRVIFYGALHEAYISAWAMGPWEWSCA